MPYTDDPGNVPADQVRFLLGDTNTSAPDLTDAEVAYLLASESDDPIRAAARGAEMLSGKFANSYDEKRVGPLTLRQSSLTESKAMRFGKLAKLLWRRASLVALPYAGGISRADKRAKEQDTDRDPTVIKRGMQSYGTGTTSRLGDEIIP